MEGRLGKKKMSNKEHGQGPGKRMQTDWETTLRSHCTACTFSMEAKTGPVSLSKNGLSLTVSFNKYELCAYYKPGPGYKMLSRLQRTLSWRNDQLSTRQAHLQPGKCSDRNNNRTLRSADLRDRGSSQWLPRRHLPQLDPNGTVGINQPPVALKRERKGTPDRDTRM